jgi:transcriptional regulator with XRE-family HTH domain
MTNRFYRFSDDLPDGHWMARQLPRGASLRGFAEDEAISVVTSAVQEAIDEAGLTRAEVATLLGTTKSYVSQVLNGSTNMTLKTLGAFLWACGREVTELRSGVLGAEELIQAQQTQNATVFQYVGVWPDLSESANIYVTNTSSAPTRQVGAYQIDDNLNAYQFVNPHNHIDLEYQRFTR